MKTRKDILEIDRESVIVIAKSKLIDGLINLLGALYRSPNVLLQTLGVFFFHILARLAALVGNK